MKKTLSIIAICAGLALSSCTGTNQQGAGTDSPQNANDTMSADTTIMSTDTTSTGTDHSASGGTNITPADSTR
ncbi:MAG: hypothetical protein EOP47_16655 [Sphingobacteriaceae bacterium]|nr:MAG: hypothetical protein EOP47_16655 [Sphingobacteriaceae bacterium]